MNAISVVPPPISTIKCPLGWNRSIPAPIAAATGSSIRYTSLAPASFTTSTTALLST